MKRTWPVAAVVMAVVVVLGCPSGAHAYTHIGAVVDPPDRPVSEPDLASFGVAYDDRSGVITATYRLHRPAPRVKFRFGFSRFDHGGCAIPREEPDLNVTGLVVTEGEGGAYAEAAFNARTGLMDTLTPVNYDYSYSGTFSFTFANEALAPFGFRCVSRVFVNDDLDGAPVEDGDQATGFCLTEECQQQPTATPTPLPTPSPTPTASPAAPVVVVVPGVQVLGTAQSGGKAVTHAPRLQILAGATLRSFARNGLKARVTCSDACRPTITVRVSRATARKLQSARSLAVRTRRHGRGRRTTLIARPPERLLARLTRLHRLDARIIVTTTDGDGTVRRSTRSVTFLR